MDPRKEIRRQGGGSWPGISSPSTERMLESVWSSVSAPLFMLGFILPDTVCRRRVPLAIKGQLLAVRHEILVN